MSTPERKRAERDEARRARVALIADRQTETAEEHGDRRRRMQHADIRRKALPELLLQSPSLGVFRITVDDKGNLATEEVVPVELTDREAPAPVEVEAAPAELPVGPGPRR